MADEVIERLVVEIESDIGDLISQTDKGVKKTEKSLKGLEKTSKGIFGNAAKEAGGFKGAVNKTFSVLTTFVTILKAVVIALSGVTLAFKLFPSLSKKFGTQLEALKTKGQEMLSALSPRIFKVRNLGKKLATLSFGAKAAAVGFTVMATAAAALIAVITALTVVVTAAIAGIIKLKSKAEKGLVSIRVRRGFKALAATVQQSSTEILKALKTATGGTVEEFELMRLANNALLLGVAKTPEEFEKLARSAIILGRAMGRGPVESIQFLIDAAGRGSKLVLDNLGLGIAEVNARMEEFAQRKFGKTIEQLTDVERKTALMAATLEEANVKAAEISSSVEDIGSNMDKARIKAQEFKSEFEEASIILVDSFSEGALNIFDLFIGPNGIFPLMKESGNVIAEIFANVLALIRSVALSMIRLLKTTIQAAKGELSLEQIQSEIEHNLRLDDIFEEQLAKIKEDYAEIFDPEAGPKAPDFVPLELSETVEETSKEAINAFETLTTEFIDLQEKTNQQIEDNEKEHRDNMLSIIRQAADARKEVEQDALDETLELEQDITKERADIIANTKKQLAQLEQDTDKNLANERESFQRDELRETEDHLKSLRRLRLSFLDNLEDAVTARDAGRVRDLQRQFARENKERTDDFKTKQRREKEDQNIRLAEIRQNEADRTAEIMAAQSEQLENLRIHEAERRQEIETSLQEQLAKINEAAAQAQVDETQSYIERQRELDSALAKRLETVAKELSDENDITREGSQAILQTLNSFFGIGGEIDTLMDGFDARRRARANAQLGLANQESVNKSLKTVQSVINSIPSFATGGTMIARRPTLAMFGEAGPEMAQFTPMNRVGTGQQKIQIEFSGSAPPGIGINERDQIAGVILKAMREAGA